MLLFQLFSTSDGLFSSKYSSDNITPMHPCHNFLHHHITKTPLDPDPGIKTPPEASLNTCHKSQNIFLLFSSELDDSSGQDTAEIRGNMTDTALCTADKLTGTIQTKNQMISVAFFFINHYHRGESRELARRELTQHYPDI